MIKSDGSKLMREGKEMLKSMERVFYDENVSCSVWTVQVAGLKAVVMKATMAKKKVRFPTSMGLLSRATSIIIHILTSTGINTR
jgi:hypothetical protein